MFFVTVKSNVYDQVVWSFAIEDETTDTVAEALSIMKSWNPQWEQCCFLIDHSNEEISAIRQNSQWRDVSAF